MLIDFTNFIKFTSIINNSSLNTHLRCFICTKNHTTYKSQSCQVCKVHWRANDRWQRICYGKLHSRAAAAAVALAPHRHEQSAAAEAKTAASLSRHRLAYWGFPNFFVQNICQKIALKFANFPCVVDITSQVDYANFDFWQSWISPGPHGPQRRCAEVVCASRGPRKCLPRPVGVTGARAPGPIRDVIGARANDLWRPRMPRVCADLGKSCFW